MYLSDGHDILTVVFLVTLTCDLLYLQDQINMTSPDESDHTFEVRDAYFRTLATIREILGHHNRTIDVLKVDIEYMEWNVFEDLLSTPDKARVLDSVNQIALEVCMYECIFCMYVCMS